MRPTLGTRLGQLTSALKILFNIVLVLTLLFVPADLLTQLGLARHGTLAEWLLASALLGLTIFYALLLAGQWPRRPAQVMAVLESSTTALAAALYTLTHWPLNPWLVGLTAFLALTAALFWYALVDS
ncbi:MAG: hypothetical protein KKA73_15140 [Chloroflexi bacterium]|nr:hypothetical protein [Chloroflexota bacterium]MBU1749021.1 hypothetical protein [Chloroflexota bacterium]